MIIGGLGYPEDRQLGITPIYELNTIDFTVTKIITQGEAPGWIWKHQAEFVPELHAIKVTGGEILNKPNSKKFSKTNNHIYWLDFNTMNWQRNRPPLSN